MEFKKQYIAFSNVHGNIYRWNNILSDVYFSIIRRRVCGWGINEKRLAIS